MLTYRHNGRFAAVAALLALVAGGEAWSQTAPAPAPAAANSAAAPAPAPAAPAVPDSKPAVPAAEAAATPATGVSPAPSGQPAAAPSPVPPAPATPAAAAPPAVPAPAPAATAPPASPPAAASPADAAAKPAEPVPAAATAQPGAPAAAPATAAAPAAPASAPAADAAAKPAEAPAAPATATAPAPSSTPPAAAATPAAIPATPPAAAAAPDPTAATAPAAAATSVPPVSEALLAAVRQRLADSAFTGKASKEDVDALTSYYGDPKAAPLWVGADGAFTPKAQAAMDEIRKADDWGLEASAFALPAAPAAGATPEVQGEAEARLSLECLKYARHARGGRFDPRALSRILDQDPPLKDPKVVLADLAAASNADAYLRGLHPKHEQFKRLRELLIKARGPAAKEEPVDEALKIKLPQGKTLKTGQEHADVALLRQRLKVAADAGAKDTLFDAKLAEAVKAYQLAKGLEPSGQLTQRTRSALNKEAEPKQAVDGKRDTRRILINMERWRWMPEDLGAFYVWNNIPEFYTRTIKDGKEVFKEKIIVGLPEWATPVFSAEMQFVIFNPSWGVPDGIKMRELLPRLQKAGGGGFFDQLFGGGGGGSGVLKAYGLTAYRNGKPVDPDSVNWSATDIRSFSFTQPPGGKNPLGFVKFRFPNKHDVYMHDTTQRELFGQSFRALSHGCMRVQNPRRFAEILLGEDKGWSAERVGQAIGSSGDITLDKHIPVHTTYFTIVVDEAGKASTFGDLYGHDNRLATAMTGRAIPYERSIETATADDATIDSGAAPAAQPAKKSKKEKQAQKKSTYTFPSDIGEALSGLVAN